MAKYLLHVADQHARALERMLGGPLRVAQLDGADGVPVAGLDGVTDEEIAAIRTRLRASGPRTTRAVPAPCQSAEADTPPLTDTARTAVKDPLLSAMERMVILYRSLLDDPKPTRSILVLELSRIRTHLDAAQLLGSGIKVPGG